MGAWRAGENLRLNPRPDRPERAAHGDGRRSRKRKSLYRPAAARPDHPGAGGRALARRRCCCCRRSCCSGCLSPTRSSRACCWRSPTPRSASRESSSASPISRSCGTTASSTSPSTTPSSTRSSRRSSSWCSGLWLALLLNRHFRGKAFVRAFILLPFIIPTVLSTFAWKWMFDPTFSVLNWVLFQIGLITGRINWLGDPDLAIISVMIVNVWRGVPFFAITLLAGLQTISPELHEAAAIDGARAWNRFRHVTWPLLLPVTMVVVLFSVIQTFADFQLVYVLTGGGPANATHLFATYAYQIGVGTGLLSRGRGDIAGDLPGIAARRDHPASLHPPSGDGVSHDRRGSLAPLGILQHPADPVRRRAVVPVLLDDRDQLPAGQRAVPAVERGELHAVLDAQPDPGAHPRIADRDAVQHLDDEHDADRDGVDDHLADLRPVRRLRPVAPQIPVRRRHRHRHLHHLPGAADAAVHSARRHHPQFPASATRRGR